MNDRSLFYVGFLEASRPGKITRILRPVLESMIRFKRKKFLDLPLERRLLAGSNAWHNGK